MIAAAIPRKIRRYLADDHRRLDGLLERILPPSGVVDQEAYAQFRSGLLKHIAIEEKILMPAARRLRGLCRAVDLEPGIEAHVTLPGRLSRRLGGSEPGRRERKSGGCEPVPPGDAHALI